VVRAEAYLALWWIPAGTVPATAEAAARLAVLQAKGPTQYAFTFRRWFPPPGAEEGRGVPGDDRDRCPA
jgi:hypothetical protein